MFYPFFQISALIIYAIIIIFNSMGKKIKTYSVKLFKLIIGLGVLNCLFDLLSYSISIYEDKYNDIIAMLTYQLLYYSIVAVSITAYFYISGIVKKDSFRSSKQLLIRLVPLFISVLPLFLYFINSNTISYGPHYVGLYNIGIVIAVLSYIVWIIVNVVRADFSQEKRIGIGFIIFLLVIMSVIQIFIIDASVLGFGVSIAVLIIYLAFEMSKSYYSDDTLCYTQSSFQLKVQDLLKKNKKFLILDIVICEYEFINNKFGHIIAEQYIKEIVKNMNHDFKLDVFYTKDDVLTVFTDDEFKAQYIANTLKDKIEREIKVSDYSIYSTIKVNLIECPKYCKKIDEIIDMKDFMSKKLGEQYITTVNDEIVERRHRALKLDGIIRSAIENDGFEMYYQPIYSAHDKKFVSSEALIRFKSKNKELGYISPEEFIPLAEEKGLINEIGEIMFSKVCSFMKKSQISDLGVKYIEVNLSGLQCVEYGLPSQLMRIVKANGIDPSQINLEITETAAIEAGDLLDKNINKLKEFGFTFSMDDFGTGYSNISKMTEVQYDLIKIDKSLVWGYFDKNNKKGKPLLENVIKMILDLGFKIVAEGVENQEMADKLISFGVNYLQGYHYSKPISELEYKEFIERHNLK